MKYSSISRRFAAMILDWIIIFVPVALATHLVPLIGGLILVFFYYPVFESSRLQATIGKHLMGIQVASASGMGGRISFREACLRLLIKMISLPLLLLGYLLVFFTEKRQALHDLVAKSVVVYGRCEASIADAWIEQVRSIFGA